MEPRATLPVITVREEGARLLVCLPGYAHEYPELRESFRSLVQGRYREYRPAEQAWSLPRERRKALRGWLDHLHGYDVDWPGEAS